MDKYFYLENGIYCKGPYNNRKLYFNNTELTKSFSMIAYIPKVLIAIKSKNTIYIYHPKLYKKNNFMELVKIASFEVFNSNAYMKIPMGDKTYIIDSNVQIKLCECTKFY